MPAAAMERSVEDCLRRPSPGATWSLGALSMFVQGVLSLVAQFPRALSPSVVPLLVRFVSETSCRDDGEWYALLFVGFEPMVLGA